MADLIKPTQQLNSYQQQGLANANYYLGMQPSDMVKDPSFYGQVDDQGNVDGQPYWVWADPYLQSLNDDPEKQQARIQELVGMGKDAAEQQYLQNMQNQAVSDYQFRLAHPNGDTSGFENFMDKAAPLAAGAFMGAGALGLLGDLGGAAAAGGADAAAATGTAGATAGATGTAAAGTGAASAGLGGAAGGLGGAWASLPSAVQSALTSMGVKGGINLATGQPLTSGLAKAGLFSGLGSLASGITGNLVGDGLQNLGIDPSTASSLVKPISTGLISAGSGLINGQPIGMALLNGIENGTISYAGNGINNLLNESGLSQPAVDVLGGAGRGAVSSAIHGGNPLTGAASGATSGAINYGANQLFGGSNQQPTSTGTDMSGGSGDSTDYGSFNGQDWLNSISSDYTDPLGITNSGGAYNPNSDPTTLGDVNNDSIANYLNQYGGIDTTSNGDNSSLSQYLTNQNSSLDPLMSYLAGNGSGDSSGSSGAGSLASSFANGLMKQLGNLGSKASANPLGALAAAMGLAGTLRNAISGTPNNFGAVSALFDKGNAANNAPATNLPQFQRVIGQNPALFTQQYDKNNNPIASTSSTPDNSMDYNSILNGLYQGALGRAPDAGGEAYYANLMKNGTLTPQQVLQQLERSPEAGSHVVMGGLSGVRV